MKDPCLIMKKFNLYYCGEKNIANEVLFGSFVELISFIKGISKIEGIPIKIIRINAHEMRVYSNNGLCFSLLDGKHKPLYKVGVFDRPILAIQVRNMLLDNIWP